LRVFPHAWSMKRRIARKRLIQTFNIPMLRSIQVGEHAKSLLELLHTGK
jgi:hypothetical protein